MLVDSELAFALVSSVRKDVDASVKPSKKTSNPIPAPFYSPSAFYLTNNYKSKGLNILSQTSILQLPARTRSMKKKLGNDYKTLFKAFRLLGFKPKLSPKNFSQLPTLFYAKIPKSFTKALIPLDAFPRCKGPSG